MRYRLDVNGAVRPRASRSTSAIAVISPWWSRRASPGQAIEFVNGVVQQSNFHDFPLARMPATPVRLKSA